MGRLEAYLVYYREERINKSLGWVSPMEYRRKLPPISHVQEMGGSSMTAGAIS